MAKISKTSTFEVPKFSENFPLGSARGLPRAAAPEAKHLCTSQLSKATIPWSSGSSRRRRPWMRRAKTAMASEEDIGGETP